MGIASRILYNKHIDNNCVGVFNVTFYKQSGEALKTDNELNQKYPPTICNGKLYDGYMSLSPINKDTKYAAYVIVSKADNQNSLSSLYNRWIGNPITLKYEPLMLSTPIKPIHSWIP